MRLHLLQSYLESQFLERSDLCPDSLEMICVKIKKPHNGSFLVSSWYRPPNSNVDLFNDFESFLQDCETKDYELYVMGDLNCNTDKFSPDHNTRKLLFLSALYQLEQLINEPTRVTKTSASLIDLVFTNERKNISHSVVIHLGISDHSMIYAVRKLIIPKSDPKIKIVRNFKNFNVNDFLRDLSQIPWETTVIQDNPNTCWKIWKSFYLGVLDRHAPFRRVRIRGNSIPWVTSDIRKLMRLRDYHKKRAVKFNSQFHWDKFRETRNKLNSCLRTTKRNYFCNEINDSVQSNDIKRSWSLINTLLGKQNKNHTSIKELIIDDAIISDEQSIAESFNNFFVNIGAKLASEIDDLPHEESTNNLSQTIESIFKFSEISTLMKLFLKFEISKHQSRLVLIISQLKF